MLQTCIRGLGTFRRPEIHEQAGAGQGYLCDAACAAAQIDELLGDKMPFSHEPADHAEIDRPVTASLPHSPVAMPMAPQECIDIPGAETVDSLNHLALEGKPPHFAVGHDVEPGCLLKGDGLIDGQVLHGLELGVTETPGLPLVPRFAQPDWPKKTTNNIGMCRNHCRRRQLDRTNRIDAYAGWPAPVHRHVSALIPLFFSKFVRCMSPLMAQSGHYDPADLCPLSGVKRTLPKRPLMSASDPKRSRAS